MTNRSIAVFEHCPNDSSIGWLCEQPYPERRSASGVGYRFGTVRPLAVERNVVRISA